MVGNDRFGKKVQNFCSEFEKINAIAVTLFSNDLGRRQECSACYKAYSERFERFNRDYRQKSPNRQNKNVCTTPSTLLKNLWDKPAHSVVNENDLAFARTLRQIERQQDRTDLRIDAENLYHAIQSFKALIDRSGATAKLLIPEEFDGYPQKLKDAIEHHDNIARLPWPANNSDQALVEFFTSNNDANNAGNISIARKLGISIAIKYISILEGQADPNALTSVDNHNFPIIAPVNFTADDFNTQWKEYVDGLTFISGINDKEKNEFSKNMKDMFFDNSVIISNCTDSFVWGGDNNAAILMSSGDDTYLMNNKGQLEKVEAEYKTRSNYALVGFDLKSQYTLNKIKRILRGINGIGGVVQ